MKDVKIGLATALAAITALALAGCATTGPTAAQDESARIGKLAVDSFKQAQACRKPIDTNPRYARIYRDFGVGFGVPSAAQIANRATIDDDEVGLGFDWYAEVQRCDTEMAERMGQIDPELGVLTVGFIRESTEIVDSIVRAQPRPTIGSINARLLDMKNREKAQAVAWAKKTQDRLKAQHEGELAARQQQAEAAQQAADQALDLLMTGLQILSQRQTLIANAQQQYMASHANYKPQRQVTPIKCHMVGKKLSCKN
jgi:hypothetical protein